MKYEVIITRAQTITESTNNNNKKSITQGQQLTHNLIITKY